MPQRHRSPLYIVDERMVFLVALAYHHSEMLSRNSRRDSHVHTIRHHVHEQIGSIIWRTNAYRLRGVYILLE
jgi:hypothetical protein